MRVLVCGGRGFGRPPQRMEEYPAYTKDLIDRTRERCLVFDTLDEIDPRSTGETLVLAQGGATGADQCAWEWSADNDVLCLEYAADWQRDGLAAGPLRNDKMLKDFRPDLVLAFPGGKGTAHMVKIAKKAKVEVREIASVN